MERIGRKPRARRALPAMAGLLAAALWALPAGGVFAGREEAPPERPKTAAEKVAGRWIFEIGGLSGEHKPILVSLAVEGDLLIGTLTVGRSTVPIHSGRVVGSQFRFSFRHLSGETFIMKGALGPRGLEGSWHGERSEGRWKARPLKG